MSELSQASSRTLSQGSSSRCSLAIVGGGGISRAHIAAAKATGGRITIAAIIDPSEAARTAAAEAAGLAGEAATKSFGSFDEFLASADSKNVQGVLLCTPPSARLPILEAALKRNLAVLAEKPLAHTLADAKTQATLVQKFPKSVTAVGYCHRFTPAIVEMKKRINAGEIGDVSRFENTFAAPLIRLKDHWMSDPKISGGGSFIDTGCHSLDLFLHLIDSEKGAGGKRGTVYAALFNHAWRGRGESSATALMRSASGVAGVIQSGWTEPARFVVSVVGTKGSFTYDYDYATELKFRPNDGPEQKLMVETHEVRFQRQLEAFADRIAGKPATIVPASFADALITAEWVDQAQKLASA